MQTGKPKFFFSNGNHDLQACKTVDAKYNPKSAVITG
jgi:hypothetical protein